MSARTHIAALAERARETAGKLLQVRRELSALPEAFEAEPGWLAEHGRKRRILQNQAADLTALLTRRLRLLRRARAGGLGDVALKLGVLADVPADLSDPAALVQSAIRDLAEIGRT